MKQITETATLPNRASKEAIGYDVYLDAPEATIKPEELKLLTTGIAARPPDGTYIRISPRSGNTVN